MAGVLADWRGSLDRWMRATNDPLLNGPVPAPVGALVGNPDSIDAEICWTKQAISELDGNMPPDPR